MGLLKTAVKTAVAVKTAHVVHDRIQRRKQAEWVAAGHSPESFPQTSVGQATTEAAGSAASWLGLAPPAASAATATGAPLPTGGAPPPAAAPSAPATPTTQPMADMLAQLRELADLKAAGVLTDEEFTVQKQRILAS